MVKANKVRQMLRSREGWYLWPLFRGLWPWRISILCLVPTGMQSDGSCRRFSSLLSCRSALFLCLVKEKKKQITVKFQITEAAYLAHTDFRWIPPHIRSHTAPCHDDKRFSPDSYHKSHYICHHSSQSDILQCRTKCETSRCTCNFSNQADILQCTTKFDVSRYTCNRSNQDDILQCMTKWNTSLTPVTALTRRAFCNVWQKIEIIRRFTSLSPSPIP